MSMGSMGGMDMPDDPGATSDTQNGLSPAGVDFSNATQAMDFLSDILDDSTLQVTANQYTRYFWYGVVVFIAITSLFRIQKELVLKSRIRAAARGSSAHPAQATNAASRAIGTLTAIFREASYPQLTLSKAPWLKLPPLGTSIIILIYLAFVIVLNFVNNDVPGAQHLQAWGIRAGWLAIGQFPLVVLLAGKNNLIGALTGNSYERLNVFHRWSARIMLLLTIMHFAYQNENWEQFGLRTMEWQTDSCTWTGIAAFGVLLWLNLSTLPPFRKLGYEFFVVQHILSFFGFVIAIMYHMYVITAPFAQVYVWIPIGLYVLDRIVRTGRSLWHNITPPRAFVTPLERATKISVKPRHLSSWKPGSHAFISIPKFGLLQSHPASILSTPTSHNGDLVFLLKQRKGFTSRIASCSSSTHSTLDDAEKAPTNSSETYVAFIDGPYGSAQSDFAGFDTVLLFSGSTGITFNLSILTSLAERASQQKLPVRVVECAWVIRESTSIDWVRDELAAATEKLSGAGIDVRVKIWVTCDAEFSSMPSTRHNDEHDKLPGCNCSQSADSCCCARPLEQDDLITQARESTESSGANKKHDASTTVRNLSTTTSKRTSSLARTSLSLGRPDPYDLVWSLAQSAQGEMGVSVCGPLGMNASMRRAVAKISDDRAIHKGTGAYGIYLHVEGFDW